MTVVSKHGKFLWSNILCAKTAAIYAQARALIDWNDRNPFCAGCGQPTLSVNAGGKRVCPSQDQSPVKTYLDDSSKPVAASGPPYKRPDCPARHGISNLQFPRTDPTVIMAVVSSDGQRIMLGRQKRWPPYWYSTLAGFCEPAESIEEAVRREVWEEAGVSIGRVVIHSTQPWPFPANLMVSLLSSLFHHLPAGRIGANDVYVTDWSYWADRTFG